MALITCPECGREKVSDTATSCPGCGFAIRSFFMEQKQGILENEDKKIECEAETQYKKTIKITMKTKKNY